MRILSLHDIQPGVISGSVLTIGNFDGVHRGHLAVFSRLIQVATERNLPSVVVTFDPHPLSVLAPDTAPLQLSTPEQKQALIAKTGVDYLVLIPFTLEFSRIEAVNFVKNMLCDALGMRHMIIGHDYAFGRDRQGTYQTLKQLGTDLQFSVEDLDPVGEHNVVFSSSLARRYVADGDMISAAAVLGRYYSISGWVGHGREIGRKLGFPTANITTVNELVPHDGVYAVIVDYQGARYQGACNIGTNPTFDGTERTIEVFLLDFSDNLYDSFITLYFVKKVRDVKKFPHAEALIAAIANDISTVRLILAGMDRNLLESVSVTDRAARGVSCEENR